MTNLLQHSFCSVFIALFALHGIFPSVSDATEPTKPNICIILVDDMGYGDPKCFNSDSKIATPNIDRIAKEGMRFTDAHAPGPLCHMSRYGLITGQYPFRTDVTRWPTEPLISEDQETIATLAKKQGYKTAMVGKWHLGFEERGYDQVLEGGPIDRGFDSFFGIRASTDIPPYFYIKDDRAVNEPTDHIKAGISTHSTRIQGPFWREGGIAPDLKLKDVLPRFTNEALKIIGNHDKGSGEPLLLYLAYPSPHTPWLPSEEFVGKSKAGQYGDFASMVDAEIGRVLNALDDANLSEDTLLIFTSDNGPVWYPKDVDKFAHSSTAHFRGMKSDAWEGGHRMPFIVRWPAFVEQNSVSSQLVCFTDFLATFSELMGAEISQLYDTDSISFLPALLGKKSTDQGPRTKIVMQAGSSKSTMVVRDGDWKLITSLGSGGFTKPTYIEPSDSGPLGQLYLLKEDPSETSNVYSDYPEIVDRLMATLKDTVIQEEHKVAVEVDDRTVDRSTLKGKVMCGYQGWFNAPDDDMNLGWKHWARSKDKPFGPGNVTIDLWPDVSEYSSRELYNTEFKNADGKPAKVYSSVHPKTIMRHFQWMQEYGIDGVFLQRFANGLTSDIILPNKDKVLRGVRRAADKTGRAYALMYDLSGLKKGETERVYKDWMNLTQVQKITDDDAYLKHNGKPLVAIWGVGFADGRDYTLEECGKLIKQIKQAGFSVMLGTPTGWREQSRDATQDKNLHEVLKLADVVSPWTVGRYRDIDGAKRHAEKYWDPDINWCENNNLDYLPVVFPGFSWYNLHGGDFDQIPRLKGRFMWNQMVAAKKAGAEMIYVAMFDEVDEATAIFKCTNEPPVGEGVKFLTYEGLPTDHYLWLTGQGGRLVRGEVPAIKRFPKRQSTTKVSLN